MARVLSENEIAMHEATMSDLDDEDLADYLSIYPKGDPAREIIKAHMIYRDVPIPEDD